MYLCQYAYTHTYTCIRVCACVSYVCSAVWPGYDLARPVFPRQAAIQTQHPLRAGLVVVVGNLACYVIALCVCVARYCNPIIKYVAARDGWLYAWLEAGLYLYN